MVAFGYTLAPAARPTANNPIPVGKCINMGGMLERDKEADFTGRKIKDSDFATIRAAGFDTVRLPVNFAAHADAAAPYAIDPVFMARVRHVVDTGKAAGLNIIIDQHSYDQLQKDPFAHRDRFVAIWRQVAEAYRNDGSNVWFELHNEPLWELYKKVNVWEIFTPAIAEIRKTNPTRPIIVAGNGGSGPESLALLDIPANDRNIIPTFHFYDPREFTEQGAAWTTIRYPLGRALAENDRQSIDKAIAMVSAYIKRTGRVPFLGEYGTRYIPEITAQDRGKYMGWVSAGFASVGVQSCAWSYINGFQLYSDTQGWLPGMDTIQTTTTLLPS